MPNALRTSATLAEPKNQRVIALIRTALDAGQGVAVVRMADLLSEPSDADHLFGDQVAAQSVLNHVAFLVGAAGAVFWDLPGWVDRPVVLVADPFGTKNPVVALFSSLRRLEYAPPAERDARAEDVASIIRSLVTKPRTRRTTP